MLRLNSPKTYGTLSYILNHVTFTQSEIAASQGISVGRVNKVVQWLVEKGIVSKEGGKYKLNQPNKLIELISFAMPTPSVRTFEVNLSKEEAHNTIKSRAILCRESALETIQNKEISSDLHLYPTDESLMKDLNMLERGPLKIHLYPFDPNLQAVEGHTIPVRTMIDLIADGKGHLANELAKKIWGTLQ